VVTVQPWLSVIIPAMNEEDRIGSLLDIMQHWRSQGVELIVVDGGSHDQTVAIARRRADHCIVTAPGRAGQQNAGAALARGDLLWFVHADTGLQGDEWRTLQSLHQSVAVPFWGRFDVSMNSPDRRLGLIATMMNLRSRFTGIMTGDQGIFVSRILFTSIGGFPQQPLMEDVALARALRGRLARLEGIAVTSAEKYRRQGWLRRGGRNLWTLMRYIMGASPDALAESYRRS